MINIVTESKLAGPAGLVDESKVSKRQVRVRSLDLSRWTHKQSRKPIPRSAPKVLDAKIRSDDTPHLDDTSKPAIILIVRKSHLEKLPRLQGYAQSMDFL